MAQSIKCLNGTLNNDDYIEIYAQKYVPPHPHPFVCISVAGHLNIVFSAVPRVVEQDLGCCFFVSDEINSLDLMDFMGMFVNAVSIMV